MERLEFGCILGFVVFHGSQLQTKVHLRVHLFEFDIGDDKATAAVQAEASGPTKRSWSDRNFWSQLNVLRLSKFSDLDQGCLFI